MNRRRRRQTKRGGQTLLELVAATTIITGALVPALSAMRNSLRVSRENEMANLMATFCTSKLEEHLMRTAGSWNPGTATGSFRTEGYPNLRFSVEMSDALADGGSPNSLMALTATVWDDEDGDGLLDAGEKRVWYASKQARVVAYVNEASGG